MINKLCPFRKQTFNFASIGDKHYMAKPDDTEWTEEFFCECEGKGCMAWNPLYDSCDLIKTDKTI